MTSPASLGRNVPTPPSPLVRTLALCRDPLSLRVRGSGGASPGGQGPRISSTTKHKHATCSKDYVRQKLLYSFATLMHILSKRSHLYDLPHTR
jgi:hypothetical protein